MKKIILTIILCSLLTLIFADAPQSMRAVATDGVFQGTFEDMYDPIDLGDISKFIFFTNLSDFNVQYDTELNEVPINSENRFLEELPLGVAFTNPFKENVKHAFFIRLRYEQTPSYNGSGMGESEEYETEYSDITGDEIYDLKTITHREKKDYRNNDKSFDFVWNNNIELSEGSLGLKLSSSTSEKEYDDAFNYYGSYDFYNYLNGFYWGDSSQNFDIENFELDSEDYFQRVSEEGDFLTTMKQNEKKFQASYEQMNDLLVKNSLLRFDLGMNLVRNASRDTDDKYNAEYEEISEADSTNSTGRYYQTYKNKVELNSNDLYAAVTIKRDLETAYAGRMFAWEAGINGGLLFGDRESYSRMETEIMEDVNYLNDPENSTVSLQDDSTIIKDSGDISGGHFGVHFLSNMPLNDYAAFGFGSYFNFAEMVSETDYSYAIENYETLRQGESIDESNEYFRTETEITNADKQTIDHTSTLKVPIALEFSVPESHTSDNDGFGLRNFVFRVGSTFTLTRNCVESTYSSVDKTPRMIITEYGDGEITETHDDELTLTSTKEIRTTVTSKKRFSAGIGYKHSENVNIDLGGYYNYETENYYVGLSFTIKK